MPPKYLYIVTFLTLVFAFVGCQTQTQKKMCEADHLLESNLDSAKEIVQSIQPQLLHNAADSAYYVLLKSIITYKSYKKQPTSTLDYPVQFYEKEKNYPLLQKAYYYRGAINHDNKGNIKTSLLDFKKAENLFEVVKDSVLLSRIYSLLTVLYFSSKKYNEQIAYENKCAILAKKYHDFDLLACNYAGLSIAYKALNCRQTAALYVDSILYNVNHIIDNDSKSTVYSNLGNFYVDEDTDKASKFYEKALYYDSNNNMAYFGLLKIATRKGCKTDILKLWNRLKYINDDELKQEIYTLFKDEATKHGDIETAYLYANKLDSLNFKVKSQALTYRVDSLQHSLQYVIDKNNIVKQNTEIVYSCFVGGIVLLIIIFYIILILVRRKKHYEKIKKELEQIIADSNIVKCSLEEKEKALKGLGEALAQKENNFKNISKENKKYLEELRSGLQIMHFVCYEKDYVLSTYQDRKNFITCYKFIDVDFMAKLDVCAATLQEQLFCSLIRLNLSKEQLMFTLSLSNDAFRKVKSRTLKKLKDKNDLKHFCDKLANF